MRDDVERLVAKIDANPDAVKAFDELREIKAKEPVFPLGSTAIEDAEEAIEKAKKKQRNKREYEKHVTQPLELAEPLRLDDVGDEPIRAADGRAITKNVPLKPALEAKLAAATRGAQVVEEEERDVLVKLPSGDRAAVTEELRPAPRDTVETPAPPSTEPPAFAPLDDSAALAPPPVAELHYALPPQRSPWPGVAIAVGVLFVLAMAIWQFLDDDRAHDARALPSALPTGSAARAFPTLVRSAEAPPAATSPRPEPAASAVTAPLRASDTAAWRAPPVVTAAHTNVEPATPSAAPSPPAPAQSAAPTGTVNPGGIWKGGE